MAAYGALVSLTYLIEQIQVYHVQRPIFIEMQLSQLETLHKRICFLQDFLESYSQTNSNDREGLEDRIAEACYAAEDIIESYVEEDIHERIINHEKDHKETSSKHFSQSLQKVVDRMDSIIEEVISVKNKHKDNDQQPQCPATVGSPGIFAKRIDTLLELKEEMNHIMDRVTINQSNLHIIPITGMGGIGKTTLAKQVYDNPFVVEYFDIRGWISVSQEYELRELLLKVLGQLGVDFRQGEQKTIELHDLGEKLYKQLSGRRYLMIIDDVWKTEVWYELKRFLPDNRNGSAAMITTRISSVANDLGSSDVYKMNLLNENRSWTLFCQKVFGNNSCPKELEEYGKKIAKNCNGLPLSLSVIGGLLAKSETTHEHWEYVAEDISTIVNSDDDDRCLKILSLSYSQLPIHLKPCFLYMGVFPEDHDIRRSELIRLWVAERFLKPNNSKCLEEVAKEYLKELIDRNLVLVSKTGDTGNATNCKIHDLLRDFCLRQAQKEKFLCKVNVVDDNISEGLDSMVCKRYHPDSHSCNRKRTVVTKVVMLQAWGSLDNIFRVVHSRYVFLKSDHMVENLIPSSMCLLWNLQTLIMHHYSEDGVFAPPEIWKMPQLRHVFMVDLFLPDPPLAQIGGKDDIVLGNLHTLGVVQCLKLTEEVIRKIPNIKKLKLAYTETFDIGLSSFFLYNLGRLNQLESLNCRFGSWTPPNDIEFPVSLKKLTLWSWKDTLTKIGCLPNLEKLELVHCTFANREWKPVDGQFLRLKCLKLFRGNLEYWTADSESFPCLEHLVLDGMKELKVIPSGIGDIPTLQTIRIQDRNPNNSLVASAKKILEDQRSLGNEELCFLINEKIVEIEIDNGEEASDEK